MHDLFIIPAILFATRALKSRREVVASAIVAVLLCALPALMFHVSFLGKHLAILILEGSRGTSIRPSRISIEFQAANRIP